MTGIEFYTAGKMILVRVDALDKSEILMTDNGSSVIVTDNVRRGILINTETGTTHLYLYTHDGMLEKGYVFNCTGDLADEKLMRIMEESK